MAKKNQKKQQGNKKKQAIILSVIALVVFLVVLGVAVADAVSNSSQATGNTTTESAVETTDASSATAEESTQAAVTEVEATAYADIDIADYGKITIALDANSAPETVENFISLAESGFYNGLTFHRIMAGFMMQGGDPNGDGTGGSEQTITGEFAQNGIDNPLSHTRGAVSMARSNDMNSASSQFFIVHEDSTFLDGAYAAFGYVTEGMDVVDAVCTAAQPVDNNGTIPAEQQPVITSITIRDAE